MKINEIIKSEKSIKHYISVAIMFFVLLVALYTIMTYGRTIVDSDYAISYRYYNAMQRTGSVYPETWNTSNGEIYSFNIFPLTLLFFAVIKNAVLARTVSSAVFLLLMCLGIIWLFKSYLKNSAWIIAIPVSVIFLCGKTARSMILFQGAYGSIVLAVTMCVGLFFDILLEQNNSKLKYIFFGLLLFLMTMGGIRYFVEYLAPIFAATVFLGFIDKRINKRIDKYYYKRTMALTFVPALLGYCLYKYIGVVRNMNYSGNSSPQIRLDISTIKENIICLWGNLINIFGYSNDNIGYIKFAYIVIAVVITIVIPLIQLIKIKKCSQKEQAFILFGLFHNAVIIMAILLCSMNEERYLLSCIFVNIIISANYIYKFLADKSRKIVSTAMVLFVVLCVYYSANLIKVSFDWKEKYEAVAQISIELMNRGIHSVYGTYWVAYPNEIYTNSQIKAAAVRISSASLVKFYGQTDDSVFDYKDGKSCLILTAKEFDDYVNTYGVDPAEKLVGKPVEVFAMENECYKELFGDTKLIIYVYSDDICDRLTDGLRDGILSPLELDFNECGERTSEVITLLNGGIVHGPYATINPGDYIVKYEGEKLSECEYYVYSESNSTKVDFEVVEANDNTIIMNLSINGAVEDIQFYLVNNNDETVKLKSITVESR
ncbi:hypothetical protein [Pseudobutyrivibrio sp.]|uniref:hypothetical protein n=1 Tax=Pseudobutyrivibrio sp. TaxID=2014367 RepID=UPI001DFCD708|nr:hypothetical protein [Pseudobutyrivibrio sp.]MBE5910024.1 hypothetical protein [Pseudobutyrivibrio sp.]